MCVEVILFLVFQGYEKCVQLGTAYCSFQDNVLSYIIPQMPFALNCVLSVPNILSLSLFRFVFA